MESFGLNQEQRPSEESSPRSDEIAQLRRTVRDLVALSALPSIWVDCDLGRSVQNLTDVLRAALRAHTVCVRVEFPDGSRFETGAATGVRNSGGRTHEVVELLKIVEDQSRLVEIPKLNGRGPLNALPHPIFFSGRQIGFFAACYKADISPTENDSLILQVAANQVGLLLQRHNDQEQRLASEKRTRSLLALMPAAVYTCDAQGRITFFNRRAAELWGREPNLNDDRQKFCAAGKCWFEGRVLAPEDTPMAIAGREGKAFQNLEPIFERPDGRRVPVLVNIDPLFDAEGKPAGAINVFQDVSQLKHTEEELRTRTEQLQAIIENTPECVKLVARDGTLLNINGAGLGMVEAASLDQVVGKSIYDVIAPEYRDSFRGMNERVCDGGKEHLEFEIVGLEGTRRWMETRAAPILDPKTGERVQLAVTRDISARKNAEAELSRKNQQLAAFLDTASVGLHRVAEDGRILWANAAEMEMLGYAPEEYIGHNIAEFHADAPVINDILKRLSCGEKLFGYEARLKCKDGSIKDVVVDSSVLWENGKFIHTQCFTRDVTDRRRAEVALRENERRLRELLEALPAAVYTTDAQGRLTMFNQAAVEFAGRMPEIGTDSWCVSWKLYWPDGTPLPLDQCPMAMALKEGRPMRGYEAIAERPDGTRVNFMPFPTPLRDANGKLIGAINMLVDITQRKKAEEALRESNALIEGQKDAFQSAMRGCSLEESLEVLIRQVVDFTAGSARAAFYRASPDGKTLHHIVGMPEHYAKAVDGFPVSGESLACGRAVHTGQPEFAVDVEQDPKWEAWRWLARYHSFRACWSFPVRTKDGPVFGTMAMYFPEPREPTSREIEVATVIAHAATVIISRHQQSADRERAEQEMRKRGERLQLLSETLGQLISARNPETIVRELFPKVAAHLGVDTYFNFMVEGNETLRLHSYAGIPEDTARKIGRLEFGQAICGTVAQTRQSIHATDIQNSDYDKAALVRGFGIQCYACNPLMVGDRLLGTLSFASRTRKDFGDDELQFLRIVSQYTAVALDRLQTAEVLERTVTERTASLREAIAQMEEFSYTVSHDLRAPLRAMQGYSRALQEDFGESLPADGRHYLTRITDATDRLDKMVLDVLTFSRIARTDFKLARINTDQLVRQMVEQYPGMQPPQAEITVEPLRDVLGHEPSLTQAVSNLLSNAVKFVQHGVKPRVRIWSETHNGHIRLWVEDNGIGIDPKYQHRLFNMFERLHPDLKYDGTGVGLAIVRKAVERMGGKAGMESDGINGSRFWLELPHAEPTA